MAQTLFVRRIWMFFTLAACGDEPTAMPDGGGGGPDSSQQCLPQSAVGTFYRRTGNPRLASGGHSFQGRADTAIADPDLRWDGSAWTLYYSSPHGSFSTPGPTIVRRGTSADLVTWSFDDAPALSLPGDSTAWDASRIETPSVAYNPDAPADRRYLLLYSGAARTFPGHAFPDYAIGAAFSADGVTFTRVPASESPHGQAGLVLEGSDAYPGAGGAIVSDPEVVFVNGTYHLWFGSFSCSGGNCATVNARGIGHATSTDGVRWTVDAAPVASLLRASADPKTGGGEPAVTYDDVHCRWEMWLTNDLSTDTSAQPVVSDNMAGVWHATSTNATSWSINYQFARDLVWDSAAPGEKLGLRTGADVARKDTGRYLVYTGFDDQNAPTDATLPTATGTRPGVTTVQLATRDAPP